MDIGTKIKKRRKELGLTQADLAEPDFTRGFISQIKNGLVAKPPYKTLQILANKLAIPIDYLLDKESEISSKQSVIEEMNQNKSTGYLGYLNELINIFSVIRKIKDNYTRNSIQIDRRSIFLVNEAIQK
ncbi:helix-turn-helix domain-containing protein [Tepidibacillus infernus]|uniref:helix-turn-helix domain-containing protein n=1 Tax=Tepidibacillus infernus TaxID=1806172 RepID=UPI003B68994B